MALRDEILEQPQVIESLLRTQSTSIEAVGRRIAERRVGGVYLAARGSSDHAGIYAKYVWGAMAGLPVALAAPSLFSVYERPPRLADQLVVGISQSGQSPDIVGVVREGRRQGALTLAITNDPSSPLGQAAELLVETCAGEERAVAATKTYTAQLMVVAMLAAALADDSERREELGGIPRWMVSALQLEATIEAAASRYSSIDRCVVLGRGFNYATAFEWSLKLEELTQIVAEPYSLSDFQHGPVAVVEPGFPIFAAVPDGVVAAGGRELLERLAGERQAELVVVSNDAAILGLARTALPLDEGIPEWLSPLVAIVPGQLFSYYLARAKGHDTEVPRGLSKVTLTL